MINLLIFGLLILITVILNTLAQTLLKLGAGQNLFNLYLWGGIFSYGLSTIFYVLVLGKLNLSFVYPLVIGLTIILTTIAGSVILREKILTSQWLGVGLILSGIATMSFGQK